MKIFGREPTLWLLVLGQGILLLGTFSFNWLDGQQAALIVVAINALFGGLNAYFVRPISPAVFTYAVGSVVAVIAAYGFVVPIDTVAAVNALTIAMLALMTRGQVSPQETPVTAP